MAFKSLRRRTHFVLEVDRFGDSVSRFVDKALIVLIVLNVAVAILQTDVRFFNKAPLAFRLFEGVSLAIFSAEYALRVWSAVEAPGFSRPVVDRLRFMLQPMMLLDLAVLVIPLGIIPVSSDLRPLRILRLLRLGRYSPRLRLFAGVIHDKRDELFVGLFVAVVLLVACSTAMHLVEGPDTPGFSSIPETMWWGVATLTTVGYGDVFPVTGFGKVLGAMVALLGVGVFALPAGILASGFSEALGREREQEAASKAASAALDETTAGAAAGNVPTRDADPDTRGTCPHCGSSR